MGLPHYGDWWTFWNLSTPFLSNIIQLIENYLDKLMTLHHSEMPRRVTSWGSKKPDGRCEIRCRVDSDLRWGIVMRLFYEYSLTILWWWADSWDWAGGCDSIVWMRILLTINVSTGWANLGYAVETKLLAAWVRIFPSKKKAKYIVTISKFSPSIFAGRTGQGLKNNDKRLGWNGGVFVTPKWQLSRIHWGMSYIYI